MRQFFEAVFQKRRYPAVIIFLFTLLIFLPALENDFTNWDDQTYVLENPLLRSFSVENLAKIFSGVYFVNYHPLTISSYLIEYSLFGPNPFIYHFTNVIFHLLNSILVFLFFRALGLRIFFAFLAGLIFGIHPVHVESVAWVSERKDVLSAFFFLAALIVYVENLKTSQSKGRLLIVFILFLFSLLSKIVAISFPLIMISVDLLVARKLDKTCILEKIPFLVASCIFGLIGVFGQEKLVNQDLLPNLSYSLSVTAYSVIFYFGKFFIPVKLSAIYPLFGWEKCFFPWQLETSAALLCIFAGMIAGKREIRGKIFFGFSVFGFIIFPSLPVVIKSYAFAADRYLYLSSVGLLFVLFSIVNKLFDRTGERQTLRIAGILGLTGILAFCSIQTWNRCQVWRNSETLFRNVIEQFPNEMVSHMNLVNYFIDSGSYPEAESIASKAVKFNPKSTTLRNALARALMKQAKFDESLEQLNTSLFLSPEDDSTHALLGLNLAARGNFGDAILAYQKSLKIRPAEPKVMFNLALCLENLGKPKEAGEKYRELLKLTQNPDAEGRLGSLLEAEGEFGSAFECFSRALKLQPENPDLLDRLAHLLATSKDPKYFDPAKAVELSNQACKLTDFKIKRFSDTLDMSKKAASNLSSSTQNMGGTEK